MGLLSRNVYALVVVLDKGLVLMETNNKPLDSLRMSKELFS
jgi:hypothetical protein